jgi:hypothetical protein
MRFLHDKKETSLAAFLLCLLGVFAISPVDYFCRQVGSRNRTVRTVRLDDHDHQDHVLDVSELLSNGDTSRLAGQGCGASGILPDVVSLHAPGRTDVALTCLRDEPLLTRELETASARGPPSRS